VELRQGALQQWFHFKKIVMKCVVTNIAGEVHHFAFSGHALVV
jgi:hypothetical protein